MMRFKEANTISIIQFMGNVRPVRLCRFYRTLDNEKKAWKTMMNATPNFPRPSPHRYGVMSTLFRIKPDDVDDAYYGNEAQVFSSIGQKAHLIYSLRPALLTEVLSNLRLWYAGEEIKNLSNLDVLIAKEHADEDAKSDPTYYLSPEMARVHALYHSSRHLDINWGRFVSHLNGLDAKEVDDVRGLFLFLDIDFDAVLAAGQLGFEMPEPKGGSLPKQEFSGSVFILDPVKQTWAREDILASKLSIVVDRQIWDLETGAYTTESEEVARAGSMEDALLLSSLYLDNIRQYFKSSMDYRHSLDEVDETPVSIQILVNKDVIVKGKLVHDFVDADERAPDHQHRKMTMTSNIWERRIDKEKIPAFEAQIEKDRKLWTENVRGDTFDQTLSARIQSNKEAIRMCDFYIRNEDLVSLILQVDKQLGKYQHAAKYFTQDLGV